ncbi:uncharacterized protein LOC118438188 [Folsomia candida]|uniref:Uncharacterized protein n=1 Tax=Folsomia candida TaxID=158441 RepID=A0A226DIE2_FOLCA|nr:uncharacterized protein LOC118438188 [Folsomia candida]OXA44748.1 hypothetical protein Fcan01_20522 [Folsomia candida]
MVVFVANLLVHFSRSFTEMIEPSTTILLKVVTMSYFVWLSGCLLLAAVGATKLQSFFGFIAKNYASPEYADNLEVINLKLDIEQGPLGIKAHTFLITHGFIVTIFSQVITYVVVLLQFTSTPPKQGKD